MRAPWQRRVVLGTRTTPGVTRSRDSQPSQPACAANLRRHPLQPVAYVNASTIPPGKTLITGANGHLGRRLIAALTTDRAVVALVRSDVAARQLASLAHPNLVTQVVDYADAGALTAAAVGCAHAVHLVGIIKANRANSYAQAHEATTRALVAAAQTCHLQSIVYLSILGARTEAANACLASKARAETLLARCVTPSLVLRLPMVLGEGDYAAESLRRRALAKVSVVLRGRSREQPIYAGDVIRATVNWLAMPQPGYCGWDLAGPESLSRIELTRRAAVVLGAEPRLLDLPLAIGMVAAALLERIADNPPVTQAMLGVLDHDDDIDPQPACAALGIELTSLDAMLRKTLVQSAGNSEVKADRGG